MAGRIKAEDVALVKERTPIEQVVNAHVTLRTGGAGSLKGLCPFHDEKTPSFTVRPALGTYHCFGCGKGGDAISFVMEMDHLPFSEAVERLAQAAGVTLRYEDGGSRDSEGPGRRARLVEANRVAEEYYRAALVELGEARQGRDFLRSKGFTGADADRFGVGYAPRSGTALFVHLRSKGFTEEELTGAGLIGVSARGPYDRFRGRVVWPIRDTTGDTVGFGARRIFDDDRIAAKYLNTPETVLYKKTSVLYGLDLARRAMASQRTAVVVEGYTDVMAMHLAGVETAVATCGTAFGIDHIKLLRRILRDEPDLAPARVVFTFDGDAAGQAAAMKAFAEDQRWAAQSYVAVAAEGQDPNDLRQRGGDSALHELVESAVPLFEFAVRTMIARHDLSHPEGRVAAVRAVAPLVHAVRDRALRSEYARTVAGWVGVGVETVTDAVAHAPTAVSPPVRHTVSAPAEEESDPALVPVPVPDLRSPRVSMERQLLQVMLQHPRSLPAEAADALPPHSFSAPAHALVQAAVVAAGGMAYAQSVPATTWLDRVSEVVDPRVLSLVRELAVDDLPVRLEAGTSVPPARFCLELLSRVEQANLEAEIREAMSALRRAGSGDDPELARQASGRLQDLQRALATSRARME